MVTIDPYYTIITLRALYNEFDEDQLSDLYFINSNARVEKLNELTQDEIRKRLFSKYHTLVLIETEEENDDN